MSHRNRRTPTDARWDELGDALDKYPGGEFPGAKRLQEAVSGARRVSGPTVQLYVGTSHQVNSGLSCEKDQVKQQITVFRLDFLARFVGPAGSKLIQQPLDLSEGYIGVFLGHQEPYRLVVG